MANPLVFTTTDIKNNSEQGDLVTIPLVLIHGWGLNSGVWQPLVEALSESLSYSPQVQFKLITIDLPGFGLNANQQVMPYTLEQIAERVTATINEPAIYLGWSLGGLVATQISLNYPQKVLGLITVASTPCFLSDENEPVWPGIKGVVLKAFYQQLQNDIEKTIKGFLKIQAMGSPSLRQDIKHLTALIMNFDLPSKITLEQSLDLLKTSDLRTELSAIKTPLLQLYGQTDSLVPKQVIPLIKTLNTNSEQHVFLKASHAPFISHLDDFTKVLTNWLVRTFSKSEQE